MIRETILTRFLILVLGAFVFAGCAGPTTPFGAVPLRRSALNHEEGVLRRSTGENAGNAADSGSTTGTGTAVADDDDDDDDTAIAKRNQPAEPQTVLVLGAPTPDTPSAQTPAPHAVTSGPAIAAAVDRSGPPTPVTKPSAGTAPQASANSKLVASLPTTGPERALRLQPKITFYPKRHILHGKSVFKVVVDDPMGINHDHQLMLIYNGINITRRFLWQAKTEYEGGEVPTRMKLTMYNLRLLPTQENKIEVIYWRQPQSQPTYARYFPPSCSAFTPDPIMTTGNFEVPSKLVESIMKAATQRNINPAILAGLIAQESGFNPRAVSYAKALGLTQITPLGEEEVIKSVNDPWPRYPNINHMTLPLIKYRVMAGKIHAGNEWRLNPEYSIAGGAAYLSELGEYWKKPQNFSLVSHYFKNTDNALSQLILASYNSGATRVNQALQTHGRRWLRDDQDLGEARKYVRKVTSYCDYFSRSEEDEDAKSP